MSLKNFMSYEDASTVLGEYAGAVNSLKSGLTNVDIALDVPEGTGKNLLPMTVDGIKAANTGITWSGNSTIINNVTFTILTDNDNNVIGIKVDGTSNANALFTVQNFSTNGSYIFNGCPANGSENTYRADVRTVSSGSVIAADIGEGTGSSIVISEPIKYVIRINNGCSINNIIFYPMIRPATITDPTFAPYIPSVESRIEAVESGLIDVKTQASITATKDNTNITDVYLASCVKKGGVAYVYLVIGTNAVQADAPLFTLDVTAKNSAFAIVIDNNGAISGEVYIAKDSNVIKALYPISQSTSRFYLVFPCN